MTRKEDGLKHLFLNSWNSIAIIWKLEDGFIYVLLQPYVMTKTKHPWQKLSGKIKRKFPGGRSVDHPEDKDFLATLRREILEELDLTLVDDSAATEVDDWITGDHLLKSYLIPFDSLNGTIRQDDREDTKSRLLRPEWVRLVDVTEKTLIKSHWLPFWKARQILEQILPEAGNKEALVG